MEQSSNILLTIRCASDGFLHICRHTHLHPQHQSYTGAGQGRQRLLGLYSSSLLLRPEQIAIMSAVCNVHTTHAQRGSPAICCTRGRLRPGGLGTTSPRSWLYSAEAPGALFNRGAQSSHSSKRRQDNLTQYSSPRFRSPGHPVIT